MSLRARLYVTALEARENPSGPYPVDPYTTTETFPVRTDTGSYLVTLVTTFVSGVATRITGTATDQSSGVTTVLTEDSTIYKIPLIP